MNYGYVRVSTKNQNEGRQVTALIDTGILKANIYVDKCSGKDFQRIAFSRMIKKIRQDDVIFVKSIDRLGRNYDEILEWWRVITKEKKADIVVLDMPLLDTRKSRDLTGIVIADIVLQLLSYVAQTEREYIRQRQAEGIALAKKRGVHFGRNPREIPFEFGQVKEDWKNGLISSREAGQLLGVSHTTFMSWVKSGKKSTLCAPSDLNE